MLLNALTVDLEEYFHVSLFERHAPPATWERMPRRAAQSVRRLLLLFEQKAAKATFFTLGWVARREGALLREILERGHEIASHGDMHRRIDGMTHGELRADLRRAKDSIEDATGVQVRGFRAPSWSVSARTSWALEILAEEGYRWDSSVFPIHHDRYGWPGRPRVPHVLRLAAGPLIEVPPATARWMGVTVPVAGGGYLRHFPPALIQHGIRRMNERERIPAVLYVHPWEIDPGQPRIPAPVLARLRHYRNLDRVHGRLAAVLDEFRFGTVTAMLTSLGMEGSAHAHPLPDAPPPVPS